MPASDLIGGFRNRLIAGIALHNAEIDNVNADASVHRGLEIGFGAAV